jgi:O-6-methylguanine DNA methyltransferase
MLTFTVINTPIGEGNLVSSNKGLCYFSLYQDVITMKRWLAVHFPQADGLTMAPDCSYLIEAADQLNEYLAGRLRSFSLPFDLKGTLFQKTVWQSLLTVPYGQTTTYGALAAAVGRPRAARGVGSAMRANPLPIFIPCHRVLPANGSLGCYGGGKKLKRHLLELEGVFRETKRQRV